MEQKHGKKLLNFPHRDEYCRAYSLYSIIFCHGGLRQIRIKTVGTVNRQQAGMAPDGEPSFYTYVRPVVHEFPAL